MEAGAEALAHACLTLCSWDGYCKHSLFLGHNVIYGISHVIVHLHIGEGEFPGHLNESDGVYKGGVHIAVRETLLDRYWDPWDLLD